nr:IS4 family transposase [Kibdelosporangium sp. MJ126-NF4]CEL15731.1 Mobile element protein [Kibdelosporangium sp. MJ126-NF4]CEL19480.1 Mobile element protein [Kibdelosporangium sp. MJ126-NF4]CEL19535.1 Mobile element protein [Kibdelosporangium sp. MJ126-NF4]CEL20015.1 Mobile element protein [Kibdelosporangium sp. MJ126-NF4]CEL21814.1 Mobile element protein [Kibdelosporangium sp. MJ126-NF4]
MARNGVVAGGSLTDWVSIGVLTGSVPRDVVDEAVAAAGKQARRSGGKLPPHVVVYFVMAMALFADDDYEEIAVRLSETLAGWGCWDEVWSPPSSGGIAQARARLGAEPVRALFEAVAVPVAGELTRGAWLGPWRLMAIDGFEWDAPDTEENVAEFGYGGSVEHGTPFPKVRVVTISECGSHAVVAAAMAGTSVGEQVLARELWPRVESDWLLIADRNFLGWADWRAASAGGAQLLWRARSNQRLPVLEVLPDGSYRSIMFSSATHNQGVRARLTDAAGRGEPLDPRRVTEVRVVEYTVDDRVVDADGEPETVRLVTTITDPAAAPAPLLARAYHQRWEHETGNKQLKTHLRGPGRVLRSKSPDMVRQEIYGYLLTHYALSALICHAATEADIDPDRVKFLRTVRIARRRVDDPAAFSP